MKETTPRIGARRHARECALQALYNADVSNVSTLDALTAVETYFAGGELEEATRTFARQLVEGVSANMADLDKAIEQHSDHWRVERMARVDRNVLRLAVFELHHLADVPKKVTLNEAVELGKKFGSEESSAFVNGVLDRIARDVQKP